MKYSLLFLFVVTFVMIDNAMGNDCTQASCDKECQDKGSESGICGSAAEGDICQCSTKTKCIDAECDKACHAKGSPAGQCGIAVNGDSCHCAVY